MNKKLVFLKTKMNAILLTVFAAVCILCVSIVYHFTAPVIEEQKQLQILNKLSQVLDASKYDNNPLLNCVINQDPNLHGSEKPSPIYRATLNGQPYALVYQTQTEQGYNGLIELMVSVDNQQHVQGVRVLSHQETPGLGDKIELSKSDWVLNFNQQMVKDAEDQKWFVKKDGGAFDQFTGATITPRAIVNQLRVSIAYLNQNFDTLFAADNQCQSSVDNEVRDPKPDSEEVNNAN